MKKVYRALVITSILLPALCLNAQSQLNGMQKEGLMQYFPAELKQIQQRYNDNTQFTTAFTNYYKSIFITDRKNYKKLVMHNKLTVGQAKAYISNLDFKYDSLHAMFSSMVTKQPSLLVQYNQKQQTRQAFTTCYPTDTNLNFTNGYLNGWNAYSEENFSNATQFIINSEVGGVCGSQELGGSTSSLDYQVAVESTLKDHLVPSIPEVPPGVKYSVRIGDSTKPRDFVGMLNQSFVVTKVNENFQYQYSLFLENPDSTVIHSYEEKPFFHFAVLDSKGDTIPYYNTIIGATDLMHQGYDSVYFALNKDYVYYTGWQTGFVSLKAYEGQCVTIAFQVSDCSLGAHFGYGYFAFSQSQQPITASNATICGSNPITLTAPLGSRFLWSGPAGAITGPDTLRTISVTMPGKYGVIVTNAKGGSAITDTLFYTLNAGIRQAKVTTTAYYCNAYGGTANAIPFGNAPFTYAWSNGQTSSSASGLAPGTYTLQATDVNSCTSIDTFAIATAPAVKITDSANTRAVEPGDSVVLFSKVIGTDSSVTYSWAPAASVSNPNSAKTYAHPITTTVYTVTATWPCGTLTDTITIFKRCTMTTTVTSVYHCYDQRTVATAIPTNGVAPFTYKWNYSSNTAQSDSSIIYPGYSSGNVVVKDNNGCKDSILYYVNHPAKFALPYITVTPISCYGLCNGSMQIGVTGGQTPYVYSWSKGGFSSTYATGLCPGTYSVVVTDALGCKVDTSATFVNPPYYKITATDSVKLGSCSSNYSNACVYPSGGVAPYSYNWLYVTNGYSSCVNGVGAGTYTVAISDKNSCRDTLIVAINGGPIQASITAPNANMCYGTSEILSAKVIGGCGVYKYYWYSSPASGITNDSAASITINPVVNTTYYLRVKDTSGCSLTTPVTEGINVGPPLSVSIYGADTIIPGDSVKLLAIASGGLGSYYYYRYKWEPGGSTSDTLKTTLSQSQQFTVTVTDSCTIPTASSTVLVVADTLIHVTICGKDHTTIKAPSGGSSYTWFGPGIFGSPNGQSVTVFLTGTYSVAITGVKGSLIADTLYYVVTSVSPTAKITTTPYYCNGPEGSAIAKPVGIAPFTYTWSNGQTTSAVSNLTPGTYTFQSSDNYGCISADTFSIPGYTIALRDSASSSKVEPGDSVLLGVKAAGADSSTTYSWAPAASLTNPNSASTYAHPTTTTTYTVTVSSPCGPLTDSITISQGCSLTATAVMNYTCQSVGVALPVNGHEPYTYKWFNGVTTQKDSAFAININVNGYVIVTDADGCKDSAIFSGYSGVPFSVTSETGITTPCPQTCNESVTAAISGGTYPYNYIWSTGDVTYFVRNLCVGTYSVQVTDAHGCQAQATYVITASAPPITVTDSIIDGTCTTYGSACVHPSGGTPPYYYNYSGNTNNCITGLSEGKNNIVILDSKGCKDTAKFNINKGPVSTTITPTNINICYGNSTKLTSTVSGGYGPYSYQWSAKGSVLPADTTAVITVSPTDTTIYTLKATDTAGCSTLSPPTAQVNVYHALKVHITGADTIISGQSVTLTAVATGGLGAYNYMWEPNNYNNSSFTTTLTASQQYTVTVFDACSKPNARDSINVFVDTNFSALYIDSLINGGCNNALWVADSGLVNLSQFTFLWSTGATTDTISNLCAGTYWVEITDTKPIIPGHRPEVMLHITIKNPVSINEIQSNTLFTLYPVPASSKLNISLNNSQFRPQYLSVYDITGRQLMKQNATFKSNIETIDVSNLANGSYLLILSDGKTSSQAKFTIMQ